MDNYTKSNSIEIIPNCKLKKSTKKHYQQSREKDNITTPTLQKIADNICADLNISNVKINFSGRRPHSRNSKRITREVQGLYSPFPQTVKIYKLTAARKQKVSTKSAIDALLHELTHHIDYEIVKLNKSIHSKGFYKRLSFLQNQLN